MKWRRIRAVILRHLLTWPRNLEQLIDSFYLPILEIVMWGFLTIFLTKQEYGHPSAVTFLLGSVMFWAILNQSQYQINITFMREVWDRNLLNLFSTPLSPWEFFAGAILLSLIKFTISVVIMIIAANVLYSFNIFVFGWYLIPFLLSLTLFGIAASFFITSLIIRFGQGAQSFAWVLISLTQPFSAVFYPLSTLPLWAQKIGLLFPATYIFEGMREILLKHTVSTYYLFMSLGLNIIYLVLAMLFFRMMFKKALEKGLLIKFD